MRRTSGYLLTFKRLKSRVRVSNLTKNSRHFVFSFSFSRSTSLFIEPMLLQLFESSSKTHTHKHTFSGQRNKKRLSGFVTKKINKIIVGVGQQPTLLISPQSILAVKAYTKTKHMTLRRRSLFYFRVFG